MSPKKPYNKLSKRQQAILQYVKQFIEKNGFPPTIREIGSQIGVASTSVVNYNLNKLVDAGYLERSDRVSRGIRLVTDIPARKKTIKPAQQIVAVPYYGRIVAGEPIPVDAYDDPEKAIEVTPDILSGIDPSEVFALEVQGDSMIDAMISDGDIILLRRQETARNGDMVAVWLTARGETTLKYFYLEDGRIRLQPAHPTMEPIYVSPDECQIQGKIISVIRRLH